MNYCYIPFSGLTTMQRIKDGRKWISRLKDRGFSNGISICLHGEVSDIMVVSLLESLLGRKGKINVIS